jgi:hypothetical protein
MKDHAARSTTLPLAPPGSGLEGWGRMGKVPEPLWQKCKNPQDQRGGLRQPSPGSGYPWPFTYNYSGLLRRARSKNPHTPRESVWDYLRPPRAERACRHVRVLFTISAAYAVFVFQSVFRKKESEKSKDYVFGWFHRQKNLVLQRWRGATWEFNKNNPANLKR